MDQFDDTTYQPARLMFWPSTSKDGEYTCQVEDGDLLDQDAVLAEYPEWKDMSYWPRSAFRGSEISPSENLSQSSRVQITIFLYIVI